MESAGLLNAVAGNNFHATAKEDMGRNRFDGSRDGNTDSRGCGIIVIDSPHEAGTD